MKYLGALIFLAACSSDAEPEIVADKEPEVQEEEFVNVCRGFFKYNPVNLSVQEKDDVLSGFKSFNDFVGREVAFLSTDRGCPFLFNHLTNDHAGEYTTDKKSAMITIDIYHLRKFDRVYLKAAVAHELAHSFGMMHVGDTGNIMSSKKLGTAWTPADKEECQRIELCTK